MPRRSTGCDRCRQRRVKVSPAIVFNTRHDLTANAQCDEARPQCERCINYGVDCSGYRLPPGQALQFVQQTPDEVPASSTAQGLLRTPLQFINTSSSMEGNDKEAQRKVRAQAMRDFRSRQRAERESGMILHLTNASNRADRDPRIHHKSQFNDERALR